MTLTQRLQALKDRVSEVKTDKGLPQYSRVLKIISAELNPTTKLPVFTTTTISPNPKIYNIPERLLGLEFSEGTVVLGQNDLIAEHVSRAYPLSLFISKVDHVTVSNSLNVDETYKIVHFSDNKSLGYKLILRKTYDS